MPNVQLDKPQLAPPSPVVVFGADHNADWQSDQLRNSLRYLGDVIDVNETEHKPDNFVDISSRVCVLTLFHGGVGVIICGTGIGVSIVANKHRGIYAARCVSTVDANDCKVINNANVLCLSGKTPVDENIRIINEFFATRFEAIDRRMDRVRRIASVESHNFLPTGVPVQIMLLWHGTQSDHAVITEYLSPTGAFLKCDPSMLPEGPLSFSLSEKGLFRMTAQVVKRDPTGVAIEFTAGSEEFYHALSRILAG
jgi:ribose 5-phosphate isomerase B